jgi:NADH:ubiquinone oxidoreductase subunit K
VTLSAYAVEAAVGLALIAYVMFRRREMTPAR